MSDVPPPGKRGNNTTFKDYLGTMGIVLAVDAFGSLLNRMLGRVPTVAPEVGTSNNPDEYRRELHTYICGYGLALALTVVPFGLVYWSSMSLFALYLAIGAFAFVQVVVHFRCFLHINPPKQNMDDLHLILFSSLLLLFMAGGTVWILANLATRMH